MSDLCRLCMGTELLLNLLSFDGEKNLGLKAASCIGIQISYNDGLPSLICNPCKEMIIIFFNFKQKCLEVDLKLRVLVNSQCLDQYNKCDVDNNQRGYNNISKRNFEIETVNSSQTQKHRLIRNNIENKIIENMGCNSNNEIITKCEVYEKFKYKPKHEGNKSTPNNKFQCEICGRIFKMKAQLDNHLLTHSGLKPFKCKLCPKRYCRTESVSIHMRSHAGIKPYVCEICGKTSTKHQDLVRHMKIHSDERKYACPRCNRHFKRANDVTSHMRTHTGLRPYCCQTCKKTYTSHSGLRKHYKSHCNREVVETTL